MPPKKIEIAKGKIVDIKVNADDIEKNKINKSIILKNKKFNVPELVIKEKEDTKEDDSKEEDSKEEDKIIKPNIKSLQKNDKINSNKETKNEKNEKNKHHTKNKKLTASKNLESSFDMFGDDDVDYRFVMMNYDYTKNKTLPKITKYEKASIVGKRAKQIESGAKPNVKVMPGQGIIEITEEELRQRKIPFILKRPIGNTFEYWRLADMEVNMD